MEYVYSRRVGGPNGAVVCIYRGKRTSLVSGHAHTGALPSHESEFTVRVADRASRKGKVLGSFENRTQAEAFTDELTPRTLAMLRRR